MIVLIVGLDSAWIVHCWFMNETRTMVLMSSAVLVPIMDHICQYVVVLCQNTKIGTEFNENT